MTAIGAPHVASDTANDTDRLRPTRSPIASTRPNEPSCADRSVEVADARVADAEEVDRGRHEQDRERAAHDDLADEERDEEPGGPVAPQRAEAAERLAQRGPHALCRRAAATVATCSVSTRTAATT